MMAFDSKFDKEAVNITTAYESFRDDVHALKTGDDTKLYDALDGAADVLLDWRKDLLKKRADAKTKADAENEKKKVAENCVVRRQGTPST